MTLSDPGLSRLGRTVEETGRAQPKGAGAGSRSVRRHDPAMEFTKRSHIMSLLRFALCVAIFMISFVPVSRAQDETTFPTDNEIQLLLTQAERGIQQYKPLIDEEESRLGKSGTEAIAKDRQVVQSIELAVQTFRKQPQGFNSALGFALFEWLDDASRNALLCSSQALSQTTMLMMAGNAAKANELIGLSQSCMDVSTLIYTVSENAGSLYERYVKAEEHLAQNGLSVSQKCAETLKKMAGEKKQ